MFSFNLFIKIAFLEILSTQTATLCEVHAIDDGLDLSGSGSVNPKTKTTIRR